MSEARAARWSKEVIKIKIKKLSQFFFFFLLQIRVLKG